MGLNDKSNSGLNLEDAVSVLSAIAETPWEEEEGLFTILENCPVHLKDRAWLVHHDRHGLAITVKDLFKVILRYMENYYTSGNTFVTGSKTLEGIKTIMVLVGEAAKKIDRCTDLFKERKSVAGVTDLREYKQLQEFYNRKISRTIDEALLGKWILALTEKTFLRHEQKDEEEIKVFESKHVFVDLDSVKNDTEYELFFIRKEDGSRFFSPRLIRNIKLVCDFGSIIGKEKEPEFIIDQMIWEDQFAFGIAGAIEQSCRSVINRYYSIIARHKEHELVGLLNKAIIALFLATQKEKQIKNGSYKGCISYLADFSYYLREILHTRDFQQLVAFPALEATAVQGAVRKIVSAFLQAIFEGNSSYEGAAPYIAYLLKESRDQMSAEHLQEATHCGFIWNQLAFDYAAMKKFLRRHSNGPLNKVIQLLEDGDYQCFDPYMQGSFPELLFSLFDQEKKINVRRLPSPTTQEKINNARVAREFLNELHFHDKEACGNILVINFQDRTSWREHSRSVLLESLQDASEFEDFLSVITLSKDTEFYNQQAPYQEDHQWSVFKDQLVEHVLGEHTGFYLPQAIKDEMTPSWMGGLLEAINRIFFSGRNVLPLELRLDFMELFYAFIELKCIEATGAENVYFCCKDGVDVSSAAVAYLYLFLKMATGSAIEKEEIDRTTKILYSPAILKRERVMLQDRFNRMISALKVIENTRNEYGKELFSKIMQEAFGPYFKRNLLGSIEVLK
jgi:hypothetical protein